VFVYVCSIYRRDGLLGKVMLSALCNCVKEGMLSVADRSMCLYKQNQIQSVDVIEYQAEVFYIITHHYNSM